MQLRSDGDLRLEQMRLLHRDQDEARGVLRQVQRQRDRVDVLALGVAELVDGGVEDRRRHVDEHTGVDLDRLVDEAVAGVRIIYRLGSAHLGGGERLVDLDQHVDGAAALQVTLRQVHRHRLEHRLILQAAGEGVGLPDRHLLHAEAILLFAGVVGEREAVAAVELGALRIIERALARRHLLAAGAARAAVCNGSTRGPAARRIELWIADAEDVDASPERQQSQREKP